MASAIIHLAVAKTLEKNLNIENKKDYYLGSIAPDISKQIGENKQKSHFLINSRDDIPNIELFINKYPNFKENSFDLGYFIHLYTDKIWFSRFMPNIWSGSGSCIKLLDGTIINSTPEEIQKLIYQDYTNLNVKLLDEYKMDLSLFYEDFQIPNTKLDEIPIDKLNILIDKMGLIIENSKEEKAYTFDTFLILQFIDEVSQEILNILNK
ncbi:MAG: zinc dependent phospholipase C family protein [Bacilli bacterium]|nr:zinc dependent phospholipase C family protein [Bacilli bacterium]